MSEKSNKRIKAGTMVKLRGLSGCKVLAFQPAGTDLPTSVRDKVVEGRKVFDGFTSTRDRYIVEVPRTGRGGRGVIAPAYYAPFAGALERENQRADHLLPGERVDFGGAKKVRS